MKRKHLFIFAVVALLIGVVATQVSAADILNFLPAAGFGSTLAFASIIGTPTTDKTKAASSELLANTISKKITEMKPSLTPLDTIIRHMGLVVPVKSWRTDYYAVDIRGINDVVAVEATLVKDGGTGKLDELTIVECTNVNIWNKDDNALFIGIDGEDGQLVGNIYAINRADKELSIVWVNPQLTPSGDVVIAATTKMLRIGNSKSELDAQTDPYAMTPQKDHNFSQIHMGQVEQSVYDKLHEKEVNWDISDFQAQSLYDMRRSMELTSIFGHRRLLTDPVDGDEKYFSGGLLRYITNGLDYPLAGITHAKFIDWAKSIFTNNSGADTRFLFAGSGLIADMSKVETIQKQIEAKKTEVVFGLTFNKIETNFGTFLVKHHQLLSQAGMDFSGIVLDMNNIEKHVFKAMDVRSLELKKSGQRLADAYVVDEAFCLALRYPDTHAVINRLLS